MPIEDSRNKGGTLTLDAQPFAKQMTSVALTPAVDEEGDALEALSGDTIDPDEVTSWTLDLGAVQDFTDPAGFVRFAKENAGDVVPFTWAPRGAEGPTFGGNVKVRAVAIGGGVNTRLTSDTSWPVQGEPDWTPAAP